MTTRAFIHKILKLLTEKIVSFMQTAEKFMKKTLTAIFV